MQDISIIVSPDGHVGDKYRNVTTALCNCPRTPLLEIRSITPGSAPEMVRNRNGPQIVVRLLLDHATTLELLQVRFTASKWKLQIRMTHEGVNIRYGRGTVSMRGIWDGKAYDLVDSKEQPRKNTSA